MSSIVEHLRRPWDLLITANGLVAAAIIPIIMMSVTADVVARYLLGNPIGWVIEYSEHGLLVITFLAMPWLVRYTEGHVRVDILLQQLPESVRSVLEALTGLVAAATCVAAAWYACLTTISQFKRHVMTVGIYPIEKYFLIGLVAYGLACTAVELLRRSIRAWHGELQGPAET